MYRMVWLSIAIAFFIVVNLFLIVGLLTMTDSEGGTTGDNGEILAVDEVFLAEMEVEHNLDGEVIQYRGTLLVENIQSIPVGNAIVTLQLVSGDGPKIEQVVTKDNGTSTFLFTGTSLGAYRVEILDITGQNYSYRKDKNVVNVVTGVAR